MEVVSEQMCTHCERSIPTSNIDLHYAHCSRNLEKCKVCGDMVPRRHAEEHFLNTHAPVSCSLCQEMMERDVLAIHKGENCPQRIVTCEFCEFPLPAIDLAEHQEVCGNRTELCVRCNRYIRLRERYRHDVQCNGETDLTAGPSREVRANDREQRPTGQPHEYSPRRILFTIAITGIAILLGSIFFQKKVENNQAFAASGEDPAPDVTLSIEDRYVTIDNGLVGVTLLNPEGSISGIRYGDVDNLLEELNDETNRGYYSIVWSENGDKKQGTKGTFDRLDGSEFKVIFQSNDLVELSFFKPWNYSLNGKAAPLNVDKRYVLLRGSSGFYSYVIYERLKEWPPFILDNLRIAFKLRKDMFHYMAVSDTRKRFMPLPDDREPPRGQELDYPEAVRLINPVEPELKGEVDDKYQYVGQTKDINTHGWISMKPAIGLWQITPSHEFRGAGPTKQFLTSHVGPTSLIVFTSAHYGGEDLLVKFAANEPWKKVDGPFFVYINSLEGEGDPKSLWEDAKKQSGIEAENWPYSFPKSNDFVKPEKRGSVGGRLLVVDKYVKKEPFAVSDSFVGLAKPGDAGSWQRESKGYQFWTTTDEDGYFVINNVIPGEYNLFAFVPGFMGDYKYNDIVVVTPASNSKLGVLHYNPPRNGPTVWEIGIADRSAAEFYIPDPNPLYVNPLFVNHTERFRQYGLWERYTELYPDEDLVFTIGENNYRTDWFFAQVTRKKADNTYVPTTWQVKFTIDTIDRAGTYKLHLSLASVTVANLQVRINDPNAASPLFSTGVLGKDNAIARHGAHGLYRLFSVDIPGTLLAIGKNTVFLTMYANRSQFQGIMYDYIRFDEPPMS
ncbi:hypothetical protein MLD38_000988 [Melastoma candidum]|uniref:Uncharacterized protein n=1 Tax=Melastoma candidum TaxID=119954 RepID=A0ACB9SB52_9MYRT|nr:hypothetical protein MLD38_000988 [Melastoma candidum]